ncbi:MAG: hypothetical protein JWL61_5250 [Gemmatimonadetes bacterium]|nr:hypothetical protein [Gemmatimonadota bacterium]
MNGVTILRALITSALVASCASTGTDPNPSGSRTRTYRMGFSSLPPRLTVQEVLRTVDSLTNHSDAALMVIDVPWVALLADSSPAILIRRDQYPLALRYQQRGLPLVATLDVTNGLNRSAEHDALVKLGRSITEPAVQRVYREYVVAFDSILHPRYLALAMETNLVRAIASAPVYSAVVTMTNAAAQQLRATGSTTQLMVSVQVETAWGRLPASNYVGIQRDRTDFTFVQALGLSSYPYLAGFTTPEEFPIEYYSRLVADAPLPMLVVEGGWSSGSVTGVMSSPALQARYIRRQAHIADAAKLVGIFQITFTDFDMASFPVPPGSILPLFAQLGLLDVNYRPKPALAVWDSVRATPLAP